MCQSEENPQKESLATLSRPSGMRQHLFPMYDRKFGRTKATKAMKKHFGMVLERSKAMINGNITDFLDKVYYGEELFFEYQGIDYFLQGWNKDGEAVMVLDILNQAPFKEYVWECSKTSMKECAKEFLNSDIWDRKKFMQIQRDVTWKE